MQDRRVDMSSALTKAGATNQFAVILVDESTGERIVLWDRDERLALQPHEIPEDAIDGARLRARRRRRSGGGHRRGQARPRRRHSR